MNTPTYFIEPLVLPLALTFNASGFRTYESCEGHRLWLGNAALPYIALRTSFLDRAKEMAQWLRNDSELNHPILRFAWSVDLNYDDAFEIAYRLTLVAPHSPLSKFYPSHLTHDFARLSEHVAQWSTAQPHAPLQKLT